MTILITLENPERTGAPRMAFLYARALASAGHRVLVASGPPSQVGASILKDLEAADIEVRRFPAYTLRRAPDVLWRLRRLIRSQGVSCVVGFQQRDRFFACLIAGVTRTRCVISAQNQHVFRGGPVSRWLKRRSYGWALRRNADRVVCTSEVVRSEVRRWFGIRAERTSVLANGIDLQAFPTYGGTGARSTRHDLGVADDERLLLSVGRLDRQKGQDLLLQAFRDTARRYARVHLALVGAVGHSSAPARERRYEDGLRSLVKEGGLEDRVRFLGWRDDVPGLLAAADLYVHAARWEGPALCLSILEAMAAGLPVICTDCSGWPEGFVEGKQGWIVPTGNVAALRRALDRALAVDVRELRRMGWRARCLVERHYGIRGLGERFVQLVEGCPAR